MDDFTCLNCGKKHTVPSANVTPKKFCNRTCYQEHCMKKYGTKSTAKSTDAPATAGASDTSRQLVDPKKCRRCEYGAGGQFNIPHCGYMFKTGTTRTALYPEGLTSTCYEFKPKQRKHKYQAPRK